MSKRSFSEDANFGQIQIKDDTNLINNDNQNNSLIYDNKNQSIINLNTNQNLSKNINPNIKS